MAEEDTTQKQAAVWSLGGHRACLADKAVQFPSLPLIYFVHSVFWDATETQLRVQVVR